jgi:hypothetical protein
VAVLVERLEQILVQQEAVLNLYQHKQQLQP